VHTHHPLRVGLHQSVDSQTHTMVGTKSDAGIMIRTVRTILDMVHSMPSVSSTPRSFSPRRQSPRRSPCPRKSGQRGRVRVNMVEMHESKIYDPSVRAAAEKVV
jgi:hypothetical protein